MRHLSFKTKSAKAEDIQRDWYVVDATNQTLGRLSSRIAHVLRGKNKAYFTPHVDCGDYVIVINSEKIKMTGTKMITKEYDRYTGYPGGRRVETAKALLARRPNAVIEHAVKGMLPKNRLGRAMYRKLFVYEGAEHPHAAQNPKEITFDLK